MSTVSLNSREGKWVMASTITASAMAFIDGTALNVILPSLQHSLNASGADLFWILNAYLLMLASLTLIGGSLGDKLGRKKIFACGIAIFLLGSALCGIAPGVLPLILFRAVQGIGGALMIPGSLSLISSSIHAKERGKAIGTWSAATTMVTIGGPILGGALGDAGLWRFIFFINIPIGLITLFMLWRKVKEIRDENGDKSLDITGSITIASALALLTFGFLRIPSIGLQHIDVMGSLAAGLFLFILFIWLEYKSPHPMMPLSLFKNRTFSGINLLTFFLYAGLGTGMLFMGLNLVQIQGYSQLQSGLSFLPFTILMIVLARLAGSLADKHGPKPFLIAGPAIAGMGLLLLGFVKQTAGVKDYWTTFFPGILVFGLGMSITVSPLTAAVMGSVNDRLSGTASGINNAVTRISNVFANAIFGALAVLLFSSTLNDKLAHSIFTGTQKQHIKAQAKNLGNATVPTDIAASMQMPVKRLYTQSFIKAYSNIMFLASALCFTGSLMSVIFIRNKRTLSGSTSGQGNI